MSSELSEFYKEWDNIKKEKRCSNQEQSTQVLIDKGVDFEIKNHGVHLVVKGKGSIIDFWPSTGKFICRSSGKKGRGVFNLIKYC